MDLRSIVEPMFIKYNLNVVFAGHEHFYERIKPQQGINYFTAGGSAKLREGDIAANSALTAKGFDTEQSFMLVEIDGDVLRFQTISRRGKSVDAAAAGGPETQQQRTNAEGTGHHAHRGYGAAGPHVGGWPPETDRARLLRRPPGGRVRRRLQPRSPGDDAQPHGRAARSEPVEQPARAEQHVGRIRPRRQPEVDPCRAPGRHGATPPAGGEPGDAERAAPGDPLVQAGPGRGPPPAARATAASVRVRGWTPPASAGWVPRLGRSSSRSVSSASASTRPGSTTAPPSRPGCTSGPPVSTSSRATRWPRWLTVTVGAPSSSRSVSDTTTARGRTRRASSAQHGVEPGAAHLLGALRDHEHLHRGDAGLPPRVQGAEVGEELPLVVAGAAGVEHARRGPRA